MTYGGLELAGNRHKIGYPKAAGKLPSAELLVCLGTGFAVSRHAGLLGRLYIEQAKVLDSSGNAQGLNIVWKPGHLMFVEFCTEETCQE